MGQHRLRLLVSDETREKWDRQLRKFEHALRSGAAIEIRRHAASMRKGLEILEHEATEAGREPLSPLVWDVPLPDGSTVALVRSETDLFAVCDDREAWTVQEMGVLIARVGNDVRIIKQQFGGAQVSGIRPPIDWTVGDDISDIGGHHGEAA